MEMEPRGHLRVFRLPHMVVFQVVATPEQSYHELRSWRAEAHSHEKFPLRKHGGLEFHITPGLALCLEASLLQDFKLLHEMCFKGS